MFDFTLPSIIYYMDQVIRKQSEMCAIFEEHNRSYLKVLKTDIRNLETHLEQLRKIPKIDNKIIETEIKILALYEKEIQKVEHVISDSVDVIGINRVYLNHNQKDMNKFGVFDGWPGTYWISRAQSNKSI